MGKIFKGNIILKVKKIWYYVPSLYISNRLVEYKVHICIHDWKIQIWSSCTENRLCLFLRPLSDFHPRAGLQVRPLLRPTLYAQFRLDSGPKFAKLSSNGPEILKNWNYICFKKKVNLCLRKFKQYHFIPKSTLFIKWFFKEISNVAINEVIFK